MSEQFMFPVPEVQAIVDLIYPVAIIVSFGAATDPNELYPGTTWTRITDKFLLGASDTRPVGTTGGAFEHTIDFNEMPAHQHLQRVVTTDGKLNSYVSAATAGTSNGGGVANASWQTGKLEVTTGSAGRGQAMSITPRIWLCACGRERRNPSEGVSV